VNPDPELGITALPEVIDVCTISDFPRRRKPHRMGGLDRRVQLWRRLLRIEDRCSQTSDRWRRVSSTAIPRRVPRHGSRFEPAHRQANSLPPTSPSTVSASLRGDTIKLEVD